MTDAEERRYAELLEADLKIRRHEGLRTYKPHPKQLAFHQSQAEVRAPFGGNQSGKSHAGAVEMLYTVGKVHPYRPNYHGVVMGRDCCQSYSTALMNNLVPLYQSLTPRYKCALDWNTFEGTPAIWPGLRGEAWDTAWDAQSKRLNLADGSFVEFMSYDQGREAFQGPQRHIIRMDEEPPQDIYGENIARQITLRRNLVFTLTPLNYSQWLFNDVYEQSARDPKVECWMMASAENPFANPEVLDAIARTITDDVERRARLFGEFAFLTGRVLSGYGEHNLCRPFPIPSYWHKTVIIDPHQEKPTGVNWVAEDESGRLFVYNEGDFAGNVQQICSEIGSRCAGQSIDLWLIDPSSRAKASIDDRGPLIDEFRNYFPSIVEANNNVPLRLEALRRLVMKDYRPDGPGLFVFQSCPVTHFQMKNLSWKPPLPSGESRGKPQVVKKNDEHTDCVGYRAVWGWQDTGGEQFTGWGIKGYAN